MMLESRAFGQDEAIPRRYTCDGDNLSPPLAWQGAPAGTRSFALVCADPDAPMGTFYHWAIFDIAPSATELAEDGSAGGPPRGSRQALNDFRRPGYGGPCPPRGHGPHHYVFRLTALDVARLEVRDGADCRAVETAARQHTLAEAVLTGLYERT